MSKLSILSVKETYWDETALAAEQIFNYPLYREGKIRFSMNTESIFSINFYDRNNYLSASVQVKDFDVDGMIEYLHRIKEYQFENEVMKQLTKAYR